MTALNVVSGYLYIGNTRGRIIVADALTMKPLCIFPAHSPREFYVKCILPVLGQHDGQFDETGVLRLSKGVVSVGRGYVDLLNQDGSSAARRGSSTEGKERTQSSAADGISPFLHHTFLLSWSSLDWEYY